MRFFEDIINIIFPNLCRTCNKALTKNEKLIFFTVEVNCRKHYLMISLKMTSPIGFMENLK